MKYLDVAEVVFKFMKSTRLHEMDYVDTEKHQADYLRKKVRFADKYAQLDDEEKKDFERQVAVLVHQYILDEEVSEVVFCDLYAWLLRQFVGKGKL